MLQGGTRFLAFDRDFLLYFIRLWIRPMWWYSSYINNLRIWYLMIQAHFFIGGQTHVEGSSAQLPALAVFLRMFPSLLAQYDGKSRTREMRQLTDDSPSCVDPCAANLDHSLCMKDSEELPGNWRSLRISERIKPRTSFWIIAIIIEKIMTVVHSLFIQKAISPKEGDRMHKEGDRTWINLHLTNLKNKGENTAILRIILISSIKVCSQIRTHSRGYSICAL